MPARIGRKQEALGRLFAEVQRQCGNGPLIFDNQLTKQITGGTFGNQYDVTKIDTSIKLPAELTQADYFVIHLGSGRHQFVQGIQAGFHALEPIPSQDTIDWKYRQSVLNETDTSEASILALVNNQRILHDFLYEDIVASPKTYLPRRTKASFSYYIHNQHVEVKNLQIEMDLTLEYLGEVSICEGKNGRPADFAVYQLYHPFRYFSNLQVGKGMAIRTVSGVLVNRYREDGHTLVELRKYRFKEAQRLDSIDLEKAARYRLVRR